MKRTLIAAALLLAACGSDTGTDEIRLLPAEAFRRTVDGKAVELYTLRAGDIALQATNYGGRVVALWTPDREGRYEDIVLGYESLDRYIDNRGERFLGAVVGPYANRIAGGRFTLDGKQYTLPTNDHGQTLHGGMTGLDRVVWDVVSADERQLVLGYLHKDGEEGFPGNLRIRMTYSVTTENEFRVDYEATTDAPTVVNLSHHSFFNLKGEGNGTVLDNELTLRASRTTPVDSLLIPTGETADVTGTPFDFREPHAIGERIGADDPQLRNARGYDHNWIADRTTDGDVEFVARLREPTTGRTLEVWSDQPAIQFYCGNFFDGSSVGKTGKPLRYRESVALETQKYPDSPNHSAFPSTTLRPGETYTHTCIYRFGAE